jgi:hypothetical protein
MAITRPAARSLSLPQQALALRHHFPDAVITITGARLTWTGVITPTPLSRHYTVLITYYAGGYPRVVVADPPLRPDEDGLLPHFYRDGSLCLHQEGQWDGSMFIADTILPWTAEWLAHYELWRRVGLWYGDEPAAAGPATAGTGDGRPRNRAERRRAQRDEARRERRERGAARRSGPTMAGAEAVAIRSMAGQNGGAVPCPAPSAPASS